MRTVENATHRVPRKASLMRVMVSAAGDFAPHAGNGRNTVENVQSQATSPSIPVSRPSDVGNRGKDASVAGQLVNSRKMAHRGTMDSPIGSRKVYIIV